MIFSTEEMKRYKTDRDDKSYFTRTSKVTVSHWVFTGSSNTPKHHNSHFEAHSPPWDAGVLQASDCGSLSPTHTLRQATTCFLQEATWLRCLGCVCGHQVCCWAFLGWGSCWVKGPQAWAQAAGPPPPFSWAVLKEPEVTQGCCACPLIGYGETFRGNSGAKCLS